LSELLVLLGILALLAMVALPALANNKARSQRAGCVANLSDIGRGFNLWATDNGNRYPFQVSYYDGGTKNHPSGLHNNLWFQFAWISNQLVSPRILRCPSDLLIKTASTWTGSATGGFLNVAYQNNAVSYLLAHPYTEDGRQMLCADRTLKVANQSIGVGCSASWLAPFNIIPAQTDWLTGIHPSYGNVLFNDGAVESLDSTGVRQALAPYRAIDPGPADIHALSR
jgi:prepilin-type processing-associated H-X9-DG protein